MVPLLKHLLCSTDPSKPICHFKYILKQDTTVHHTSSVSLELHPAYFQDPLFLAFNKLVMKFKGLKFLLVPEGWGRTLYKYCRLSLLRPTHVNLPL